MKQTINSDSIYRAVVEVLTNNYTANLFSSLQRENLAKKVSHKLEVMLEIDKPNNVATHMGDQIIEDENINDGLTKEKANQIKKDKLKEAKKRNAKKKIKKPVKVDISNTEKSVGLKNLK